MKKLLAAVLSILLCMPLFTGCINRNADLNDKVTSLSLSATDFVENSHTVHGNAKMNAAYTALRLEKNVPASTGYMVRTIQYRLDKGTYRLTAELKVSLGNSNDPVVQLHAVSKNKVVANLNIMGPAAASKYMEYAIDFTAPEGFVSFGIYSFGRNDVELKSMRIERVETDIEKGAASTYLAEDEEDKAVGYAEGTLYYYDIRSVLEELKDYSLQEPLMTLCATLQGLVNRNKPRLYVRFLDDANHNSHGNQDEEWLEYLTKDKQWLPSGDKFVTVKSFGTLLRIFQQFYKGLTVWDQNAPATYNVGMTDCGVNDRLLVKYSDEVGSSYKYLTQKLGISVALDLHDRFNGNPKANVWDTDIRSTGSKKNDPYIYAIEKYIKTKKSNPTTMSTYLDGWVGNNGVSQPVYYDEIGQVVVGTGGVPHWTDRFLHTDILNRDYFVAKKAFFFDLSPVIDEPPIDDLNQSEGLDYETFEKIMSANNINAGDRIVEVGGFTNWQLKYSDASVDNAIDGGALEPAKVKLLTKYNATMQADASAISAMANGSVYTLYPAKTQYNQDRVQNKMKAESNAAVLKNKNYVLIYMGDYDGAAWVNRTFRSMFSDPKRGQVPLMWPVLPINESRVKHVYDYLYENATDNDIFVGGNNGIGYNYLDVFLTADREGINGDIDTYFDQTVAAYNKYDLDIMGMYFGGWDASNAKDAVWKKLYSKLSLLSPYGVVTSRGRRVDNINDYYNAETGTVFQAKDPFDMSDGVIQCGNQNFVIEGEQQHQLSVMSASINVTELNRPHFNVLRPVLATPSQIVEGLDTLNKMHPDYQFEAVNPYTYFKLYKQYLDNCLAGAYDNANGGAGR